MKHENKKETVLFICTHNSARSQIAEGFLRSFYADRYEAHSAGTEPSSVNPHAVQVMTEIGIDISSQRSKGIDEFINKEIDYVITVCDHARQTCPFFPGGKKLIHKGFKDPASFHRNDNETLALFRQVRDEIKAWIEKDFVKEIE